VTILSRCQVWGVTFAGQLSRPREHCVANTQNKQKALSCARARSGIGWSEPGCPSYTVQAENTLQRTSCRVFTGRFTPTTSAKTDGDTEYQPWW
jgi:hypothetical protein